MEKAAILFLVVPFRWPPVPSWDEIFGTLEGFLFCVDNDVLRCASAFAVHFELCVAGVCWFLDVLECVPVLQQQQSSRVHHFLCD